MRVLFVRRWVENEGGNAMQRHHRERKLKIKRHSTSLYQNEKWTRRFDARVVFNERKTSDAKC